MAFLTDYINTAPWNDANNPWTTSLSVTISSNFVPALSTTTTFTLSVFNPTLATPAYPAGYDNVSQVYVANSNPDLQLYYHEKLAEEGAGDQGRFYREWYLINANAESPDQYGYISYSFLQGFATTGFAGTSRQVPFCDIGSSPTPGGSNNALGWYTGSSSYILIIKPGTVAPWELRRKRLLEMV